jgi:hypothetical protein
MATTLICSIPNCDKGGRLKRGLCSPHYQRWRAHGDPLAGGSSRQRNGQACSIEGCGKPARSHGWCSAHHTRWLRNGDPVGGRIPNGEPLRYFREVVLVYEGDECLMWPFGKDGDGYGRLDSKPAHRQVCEEVNGPPPTSKHEAAHSCGKGASGCVTKRHLSWKTHAENQGDRLLHGTHNRGTRHGASVLTEEQVRAVRLLKPGRTAKEVSELTGVSPENVSHIVTGQCWAWLDDFRRVG